MTIYLGCTFPVRFPVVRTANDTSQGNIFVKWAFTKNGKESCKYFPNLKEAVQFVYDNRYKWNTDLETEIQIIKLYKEHCEDNYV